MAPPNVLISGSGIAGSVFAHWLLRAYPMSTVTIVERAAALRLSGAAVDIRSSAVDIIQWMNAESLIRKNGTKEEGMQWVDAKSKPIATMRSTGRTDMQSMTSEFEIMRGTLAKIFMDTVQDRIKLVFDDYVDKYEQDGEGVTVTFAKSQQVKKYDLLVAADGLYSKIRGNMLDSKPADHVFDEGVHVCYFTVKSDLLNGELLAKGYSTTKGRCIFLRPDPNPAGRTSCLMLVVTLKGDTERKERLNKAVREGNESYKTLMEEIFSDAGWILPELLQSMRESDDFYCSLFGQARSPKLCDGRVILLGDAGYATPGFGTSLAIMGGYVLAGELLRHPDDVATALKKYEELMQPFAKGSQGGGGPMQLVVPQTEWGISLRNNIMSFVFWAKLDRVAMTAASFFGFAEKKLSMPDYPWPAQQTNDQRVNP